MHTLTLHYENIKANSIPNKYHQCSLLMIKINWFKFTRHWSDQRSSLA